MVKVTAAILIENGKILIARRKQTGKLPGLWEFPGGKIEPGESAEQCLKRELKEEFEIHVGIDTFVGTNVHAYDFGIIELAAYIVRRLSGDFKLNDHAQMAWVTAEEIGGFEFAPADRPFVKLVQSGKIGLSTRNHQDHS